MFIIMNKYLNIITNIIFPQEDSIINNFEAEVYRPPPAPTKWMNNYFHEKTIKNQSRRVRHFYFYVPYVRMYLIYSFNSTIFRENAQLILWCYSCLFSKIILIRKKNDNYLLHYFKGFPRISTAETFEHFVPKLKRSCL